MPVRQKSSTTRLPQSLLQEIGETSGTARPSRTRYTRTNRKATRKQERNLRKERKAAYYASAQKVKSKKPTQEDEPPVPPPRKRAKLSPQIETRTVAKRKVKQDAAPRLPIPEMRSRQEQEEDKYISFLETNLGYTEGKKRRQVDDDGLGDLLDWADNLGSSLGQRRNNPTSPQDTPTDKSSEYSSEDGVPGSSDNDTEDEWKGIFESEPAILDAAVANEPEPQAEVYNPPRLRNAMQNEPLGDSEASQRLKRQLKGLFNRMSEQNIASILDSIEELYRTHRRHDVTHMIATLILDGISSHSTLLDSFVILHAAFVSSMYKIMGVEFAAQLVQQLVARYEDFYRALPIDNADQGESAPESQSSSRGKECSNLIVLFSELYNFQVISSVLIFDIIRGLLDGDLTEINVELLLKLVRNSGQQLRQDDPAALKDIIQIVQGKVSSNSESTSSRTRFMIETLSNLKNHKLKRNVTQNQSSEAVERMKKFLSSLGKKKHVLAHEPLRASLQDLHSAESKGKWWLVGAAWAGDPLLDCQQSNAQLSLTGSTKPPEDPSGELLNLARQQGMNTDIRRSIFIVLMSSDDYVDACERLAQLSLKEIQQREIVRVLLLCSGNEKSYNPYYTLVCQHLCRTSHAYKITIQFCLWDFLRDLGEVTVGGAEIVKNIKADDDISLQKISQTRMRNVAKAYGWWIAKDSVTLSVLKPVDFTILKTQGQAFLREMMEQIFISSQIATPIIAPNIKDISRDRKAIKAIFTNASKLPALATGLIFFLSEVCSGDWHEEELAGFLKWASDVAIESLRAELDGTVRL